MKLKNLISAVIASAMAVSAMATVAMADNEISGTLAEDTYAWSFKFAELGDKKTADFYYDNDYAQLHLGVGEHDSASDDGKLKWHSRANGVTLDSSHRYIIVKPKFDGQINLNVEFKNGKDSGFYYSDVTEKNIFDFDCTSEEFKAFLNGYGTNGTGAEKLGWPKSGSDKKASTGTQALTVTANHVYLLYPYAAAFANIYLNSLTYTSDNFPIKEDVVYTFNGLNITEAKDWEGKKLTVTAVSGTADNKVEETKTVAINSDDVTMPTITGGDVVWAVVIAGVPSDVKITSVTIE